MLVVTEFGVKIMLENMVGLSDNHLWYMRLFTNDHTPSVKSTFDDFQESESCEPQLITEWKLDKTLKAAEVNFKLTGQDVYGYFVTDLFNNVIYAEKFPSPMKATDVKLSPNLSLA